jgi:tetratricopeptide (TPR) repeat protein
MAAPLFPKLNKWYLSQASQPPLVSDGEVFHLFSLAKGLYTKKNDVRLSWTLALEQIIATRPSLLEHILETDALAVTLDTTLVDIYSALAEDAIQNNQGRDAFDMLVWMADKSGLAAFRFLVAWIAFNLNNLELCINECEKVEEPYAPIHTLLGQALLEAGRVASATEALKVAIALAPSDPLPIVQLIKAYLITGRQQECFAAINRCRKIVGNNLEIECLASMAILAGRHRPKEFCIETLRNIANYLSENPHDSQAFAIGMELAAELNLRDWAQHYAEAWNCDQSSRPQDMAKQLAKILKRNHELNWHEVSRVVLDKTIAMGQQLEVRGPMQ